MIQVKGDCQALGDQIAHEHGYRYVRQVGFADFERRIQELFFLDLGRIL